MLTTQHWILCVQHSWTLRNDITAKSMGIFSLHKHTYICICSSQTCIHPFQISCLGKGQAPLLTLCSYSQGTDTKQAWITRGLLAEESLHYGGSSLYFHWLVKFSEELLCLGQSTLSDRCIALPCDLMPRFLIYSSFPPVFCCIFIKSQTAAANI